MLKSLMTTLLLCAIAATARGEDTAKPEALKEPELRRELLERMDTDQKARTALIKWNKQHPDSVGAELKSQYEKAGIIKADKENTAWLKEVVEKYGWPTKTMVGRDGANAAWLLVQHADADVKFQRKCLDLMAQLPKDELSQMDFAYLTDRVLLAEGKKQIYGTQFDQVDGKLQPRPLEDEANVDKSPSRGRFAAHR